MTPLKRICIGLLMARALLAQASPNVDSSVLPGTAMPAAPNMPYYEWNVCPGEGCVYGQWVARGSVMVYNTYRHERFAVARLAAGDRVSARTGVVVTVKPGIIRMDRAVAKYDLKPGDKILSYAYSGEGFATVWFNGRLIQGFDISFTKWPDGAGCHGASCRATYLDLGEHIWWAEVKLASGKIGWVNMNENDFDGTCSLKQPGHHAR